MPTQLLPHMMTKHMHTWLEGVGKIGSDWILFPFPLFLLSKLILAHLMCMHIIVIRGIDSLLEGGLWAVCMGTIGHPTTLGEF